MFYIEFIIIMIIVNIHVSNNSQKR